MSPNETIGVAVQGAGNVATGHLAAYLRNPRCRVVAIGSRTTEGAARKAREVGLDPGGIGVYDTVDALLAHPGVDAVSICTPHARHAEDAIAAARWPPSCDPANSQFFRPKVSGRMARSTGLLSGSSLPSAR